MVRPNSKDVIVNQSSMHESAYCLAEVHHRSYPELRGAGRSPREGALRLVAEINRALDGVSGSWHRDTLTQALADVRAFIEEQQVTVLTPVGSVR